MSLVTDLINAVLPVTAHAEEPVEEVPETVEADAEEGEASEDGDADEDDEDEDEDDDDEDDDDDEEAEDQYDALKGECAELPSVKPFVHHYEECVERVTKEQEEPGYEGKHYKEDCVEEFFHLQHALTACAAPKLFSKLN
ncbi:hypothetical protein PICMEDRAFT_11628 [Pichia membranifaciens NRRL Y-2026]|uniref:Cytochrome b-c1 complex subunit 6, mitochondrial n=1 Tax=Pichia membranifaciens NRRL Y-2026 TaxID=763406 RepID=A0A1E3NMN2_9ASCO|nr:hypothetical protein PICMEDRAFT_11628 [Pichia membranifaciens NRRL Y-2026]ODQ46643.1 hypothetical protein PICMEDRAFT_11628 [Pichia membranifaciens NRRL Y-2026]